MTQVVGDPLTIDLGELGGPQPRRDGRELRIRLRRRLGAAALALLCLLTVAGSTRRIPALGEPLWSGEVSLNGFGLGAGSVYLAAPAGDLVLSRDLSTGRQRWSLAIGELPDRAIDLGNGVAAVLTRRLSIDTGDSFSARPDETIRFIQESTGQQIGQTAGSLDAPSVAGLPAVVFQERSRSAPGCAEPGTRCVDVTAWNVATATVAWRLSLPPGNFAATALADADRYATELVEVAPDGAIRMRDLVSGAIVGQTTGSPGDAGASGGQVGVTRDGLVTARREPEEFVLTGYQRPSLRRLWSVRVPAAKVVEHSYPSGYFRLDGCGTAMCLHADGRTTRIIDMATGSVTPELDKEVQLPLGDDLFIATPTSFSLPRRGLGVYVVNRANRVVAEYTGYDPVPWTDTGGRVLLAEPGPDRTGFLILDRQGRPRNLGSVPGTSLQCGARGDILVCGDAAGLLRAWRLPM